MNLENKLETQLIIDNTKNLKLKNPKPMKHNLIIAIFIATSLFACKKKTVVVDDNNTNNNNGMPAAVYDSSFVRFLANGVFVEIKTSSTGAYGSTIDTSSNNQLSIYYSNNLVGASTRTFLIGYNQASFYVINVPFTFSRTSTNNSSTAYWINDNFAPTYGMLENNTAQNTTITITKIKNINNGFKAVNGTFSAKLVNDAGDVFNITNGEFFDIRTN